MKDYETEPQQQLSKINSGMLIILRLNELWKDAHRHARKGNYSKWNDDLDRVWCEIGGDEKEVDEDDKDYSKSSDVLYKKLTLDYADTCKEGNNKPKGFEQLDSNAKISITKQKQALIKKELFLRRLQNKQGKGTAYHDSSEDYMD